MGAAAPYVLTVVYATVGSGILASSGVLSRFSVVTGAALSIVAGWAAVGIVLSLLLMLGAGVEAGLVVCAPVAFGGWAAGFVRARRSRRSAIAGLLPSNWRLRAGHTLLVIVSGLVLARGVFWMGAFHPDVWSFWIPKAKVIYFFGGLDTGPGGFTSLASPDYPPMKPALDAAVFTLAGRADPLLLPVHNALLDVAFLGAALAMLRLWLGRGLALLATIAVAALPGFVALVGSSLADESLAVANALAALLAIAWLRSGEARFLALTALFLTAAVLLKSEGAMLAAGVIVATAVARARLTSLVVIVPPVVAFASWRSWLLVHHVPPNFAYHFSWFLHPRYLVAHPHRLFVGTRALLGLAVGEHWVLAVPLAFALALVAIRGGSPVGVFAAVALPLWLVGYMGVYWVSVANQYTVISENTWRIFSPIGLAGAVLLPVLLVEIGNARSREDALTASQRGRALAGLAAPSR